MRSQHLAGFGAMMMAACVMVIASSARAAIVSDSIPPEDIVNWNAVIVEVETSQGLARYEHAVGTDKFVYGLDESVRVLHRITNIGELDVVFPRSSPRFDLDIVQNQGLVWSWSADKFHRPESRTTLVVPPASEYSISYESGIPAEIEREPWSLVSQNGDPVSPGLYGVNAIAVMMNRPTVSVTIQVVPEPTSGILLLTGYCGLVARRRCL